MLDWARGGILYDLMGRFVWEKNSMYSSLAEIYQNPCTALSVPFLLLIRLLYDLRKGRYSG